MKGFMLVMICCLCGCITVRAERFEKKDTAKTPERSVAKLKPAPTIQDHNNLPEVREAPKSEEEVVELTKAPKVVEAPKLDPNALIATMTEDSGGMVQQLGIKGDWQLLTWTNGFQILVAASSNYTEGTPWYRIAVIKDGRIEYHDQIMVDPTAEEYEGVNNCDSFSPAVQTLNGPIIAIGLECYNEGGDNNYATDHVLLFRVERPPTSMADFTLLKRIKANEVVSGYYEDSWTKTTLEIRDTELWRTDQVKVGVSVEEQMQGIEREPVITTSSEKVLDL